MSKHTPGPWEAVFDTNDGFHIVSVPLKGTPVAIEPWHGGPEHSQFKERFKANANLIAAAPELLEACQYSLKILKQYGHNVAAGTGKMCWDAVQKAMGRSS